MVDPVMDSEGNTYERSAVEDWIRIRGSSPITRNPLQMSDLVPNRALKAAIETEGQSVPASNPTHTVLDPHAVEPVISPVALEMEITALPCQDLDPSLPCGEMFVMTNVSSPSDTERSPFDIVLCVDVSGSMGQEAQAAGVESSGLSMLDIVKHAVKTIINTLRPDDRVAVVSYSNAAKVCCDMTFCTSVGQATATEKTMSLQTGGMTNLWDGLKTSLDLLNDRSVENKNRNGAVLLLTDGTPNVDPPRGYVPSLQRYKDKAGGKYPGAISTFGFGYNLKSDLLLEIASEGAGTYAFIPDSGFVGTVFVNALANTLTTCATNVTLAIEAEDSSAKIDAFDEYCVLSKQDDGVNYISKTIQIGQPYGSLVQINKQNMPLIMARLQYNSISDVDHEVTLIGPTEEPTEAQKQELACEFFRISLVKTIEKVINFAMVRDYDSAQAYIAERVALLESWTSRNTEIPATPAPGSTEPVPSAHKRIRAIGEDLKGQVTEAVSKDEYFTKWGAHYMRSLMRTHMLKQCNNFKDPGVQMYGNKTFRTVRDDADDIFSTLPPPTPTTAYDQQQQQQSGQRLAARSSAPVLSMSSFNRSDMVCFHNRASVHMHGGVTKNACDVVRGDVLLDGGRVLCVVRTDTMRDKAVLARVVKNGKELLLTPYHPILWGCQWEFPINVGELVEVPCTAVFSYLVERLNAGVNCYSSEVVVDGVTCATLAHGVRDVPKLSHDFFGTNAVADALKKCKGFDAGLIVFQQCSQGKGSFLLRDSITNDVSGLVH